jgi:hypothetical protein
MKELIMMFISNSYAVHYEFNGKKTLAEKTK